VRGVRVGRPPLEWTDEDLAKLRQMRADGLSMKAISEQLVLFDTKGTPRSPSVRALYRAMKERGKG